MSMAKIFTAQPRVSNCTILPNEVYQLKLSATAFAIYSYLRRLADPETHQCWPSYANIADTFGCSKRTVGKYVAELCEAGLIGIEATSVMIAFRPTFSTGSLPHSTSFRMVFRPIPVISAASSMVTPNLTTLIVLRPLRSLRIATCLREV